MTAKRNRHRNDLINLARAKHEARDAYHKAYVKFAAQAPLLEPDHFWTILAVVAKEVKSFRFCYGRTNGTKQAAEEVGRQCWCKQLPKRVECTTEQYVSFANTYRELVSKLYKPLFDVVTGYGDDGYGDLLDTLPLLGREFVKRILEGEWGEGDHDEFISAIKGQTHEDWKLGNDPKGHKEQAVDRFFIKGEEYVCMSLDEAAEKYLCNDLREQEVDEKEHEFV